MLAEELHGRGELVAGRVGARAQHRAREHSQLGPREPVAFVLGLHELGHEVVAGLGPPLLDHGVDVRVELVEGAEDVGLVVDRVELEDLEDLVGPVAEERPIAPGRAEQLADDRDRVPLHELDDVELAVVGRRGEQLR